jgi:vitamin B12 transporter
MSIRLFARAFCAALLLGGIATASAGAQTLSSPSPAPSPVSEIGHVQTSERSNETVENVARSTYVVSKSDIIRNGYRTVADAIENIPGVNLNRYGPVGSLATASMRGSTSEQVLVLSDGIPLGTQSGAPDLDSIPLTGIDRIEVVEGGGSLLYGAGSIGGIINIITKPLAGSPNIVLQSGSFGDRLARIETKNFSFERSVATNTYPYSAGNGIVSGTQSGADSEVTAGRFVFEKSLGGVDADFSGGINQHHLGVPGSVPATFTTPGRQNSVDKDLHLGLTKSRAHSATTLEFGASAHQLLAYCDDPANANCSTPLGSFSTESRLQASLRNVVSHTNSKSVYGIDFARDVARIDDGGINSAFAVPAVPLAAVINTNAFSQSAVYVQQNWLTSSGSRYYAGLRAERDAPLGGIVAPAFGFLQHLSADVALRGNFATSFRAPNSFELYYPNYGNPQLQPERARVADLKLTDNAMLGGASVTWFGTWSTNFITTYMDPVTFAFSARNIGRTSTAGLIGEVRTRPFHKLSAHLSVTDLYRALDQTPGSSTQNGRLGSAGPVFTITNEFVYQGDPNAAIESAGISARNHGGQVSFGTTAPYTRIDGFVRVRVGRGALLSLRGYNLGNDAIQDQPGYPQPGRSFILELSTH